MLTSQFAELALSFFSNDTLEIYKDDSQYGFNNFYEKKIKRVGVCVNLTLDVIKQAANNNIDLILTHHNIWDEFLELREDCLLELKNLGIIHFYNHLPLDSAPFGPSRMLLKSLSLRETGVFCSYLNHYFGVVGEPNTPLTLRELENLLTNAIGHKVRVWKNNDGLIRKVGIVSGSGGDIENLHEAKALSCDAYITGEKKSKTLLYAQHVKMNFLLGSHTFTEIAGIREYARMIADAGKLEVINLQEDFFE